MQLNIYLRPRYETALSSKDVFQFLLYQLFYVLSSFWIDMKQH